MKPNDNKLSHEFLMKTAVGKRELRRAKLKRMVERILKAFK